ncbi:MAG: hypothetical protein ABFD62_03800 [Syntrophaceae bacterium]
MDFLFSTEISVNLFQIMALLVLSTVALLYGMTRIALLINYAFIVYWGYLSNFDRVCEAQVQSMPSFSGVYVFFGFLIILLASFGLLVNHD